MNINVENDAMLERNNDSIYATKFYVMQKQIDELRQENKQLKEQLSVAQTNEETFRLEMKDITKTLGLDEDTLFDDVKVYVRSLKDNWNKLKEYIKETKLKEFEKSYGKRYGKTFTQAEIIVCNMILDKIKELETPEEEPDDYEERLIRRC